MPAVKSRRAFFDSRLSCAGWLCATVLLSACSVSQTKVSVSGRPTQTGIASWYGPGFHGKPTASGTIYDQNEMTAAHQTLPLGSRIMVTNLDNGRSAELTVTDRGPFAKGRILDLSYASAEALAAVGPGTIPVQIEVIDSGAKRIGTIRSSLDYTLQLGSFTQLQNAQELRDRLMKSFGEANILALRLNDMTYYRVQMGTFSERAIAEGRAREIARAGFPVIIMEK